MKDDNGNTIKIKSYTLYWLNGKRQVIKGFDFVNAFTLAGYKQKDLSSVDFTKMGNCNKYVWNKKIIKWELTERARMYEHFKQSI